MTTQQRKRAPRKTTPPKKKDAAPRGFEAAQAEEVLSGHEQGVTIHLHDHRGRLMTWVGEDGEEKPVRATFAGKYSERYQAAEREIRDRRWKRGEFQVTSEELRADQNELISRMLLSWEGFTCDGEPLEPTPEACLDYLRFPWIREQFDAGIQGRIGFFANTSGA